MDYFVALLAGVFGLFWGYKSIVEEPGNFLWGLGLLVVLIIYSARSPGGIIKGGMIDNIRKGSAVVRYGLMLLFWSLALIMFTGTFLYTGNSRRLETTLPDAVGVLFMVLGCSLMK
jgi:hypothetical protein